MKVKVLFLPHFDFEYGLPRYETAGAAGADVRAMLGREEKLVIPPGKRILVPTGLILEIPQGFEIQVRPRSGLSYKTGLLVVNSPGTIDSDYRGELMIILGNFADKEEVINHGDRIAQIVFSPVIQAEFIRTSSVSTSSRGKDGFGSTGKD